MNTKKYIPNIAKREIIQLINAIWTASSYLAQNKHAKAEIFQYRRPALNLPHFWHRKPEVTGNVKGKEVALDTDEAEMMIDKETIGSEILKR
jgi:hypothetical protein